MISITTIMTISTIMRMRRIIITSIIKYKDAEFLVMVEEGKCGPDIQSTLENDGTYYCFMDDFCTGNIKSFKNAMFVSALKEEVEGIINIDTKELCDGIVRNLRMDISSTEKSNYYNLHKEL